MPKSRRVREKSLSQVEKRGSERKDQLIENIHACVEKYDRLFVFEVFNMRNNLMAPVREKFNETSRFCFGKNKVMQVAIGKTPEDECADGIHKVSQYVTGNCGLMFTNETEDTVVNFFATHAEPDFPKSGFTATKTVRLERGPLPPTVFTHSMEPYLRTELGMPVQLVREKVELLSDFVVCEKGDVLTPDRARILKLLGEKMSLFCFKLRCEWDKAASSFKLFHTEDDAQ